MAREKFTQIYTRAAERKGGEAELESLLATPLSLQELNTISDARWLAAFTQKVFQCGMSWRVVRSKWQNFEEVFFEFDIEKMLLIPNDMWERKATDPAIIRHLGKVMTIPENAQMIHEVALAHGSFAAMVADWPQEDIIGLWRYLKRNGKRLGGNTGPYTLRVMGKDTFILSHDVEAYLRNTGIIDGGRDTQKSLSAAQAAFNDWQQETGRPLCQISQIIAFSSGDNHI
ncbi:DNA-3-methyladenine glycosylase I [Photobacterium sp.]|uniref:DNA-3-methyladenine glycosylase I n=1 Tax=Photobacterium sp. TaxID=660 RepID=UPI00299D0BB7|nr:DNA-3-methyladenine glycosylase I [Photobacterium sp.]MDX1304001.1 DNA-3-methyladenine glycosylase I [Photobacterium sp.]